jgi:aspartate/methionine/tyrosine aminotransferase
MCAGRAVGCDTYPDFRLTAERVEPLITERTKLVLLNSPSNPAGAVLSDRECRDLLELCRARNVLLISDEIYDQFTYAESRTQARPDGPLACPSPAREAGADSDVLLVRGFGKTYGVTGWRMGYAAGPKTLIEQMAKLQQYTYVCAPTPSQHAAIAALDVDMSAHIAAYQRRRDLVVERLSAVTEVTTPGGAFYAFVKVPERLGVSATAFVDRCIERSVLVIPGGVFSDRDTHIRLSFATDPDALERGLDIMVDLMRA